MQRCPTTAVGRLQRDVRGPTCLVLLALLPYGFGPNATEKLTELFVLIILAAMWNALAGYAGLVSVGQQAFIGIGAYAVIVLTDHGINGYRRRAAGGPVLRSGVAADLAARVPSARRAVRDRDVGGGRGVPAAGHQR